MSMKIGVLLDSFRLPFEEAIDKAAELGADGIQMYTTAGSLAPWNLNTRARQALRSQFDATGLEISALCGDLGGHGFSRVEENPDKIRKTEAIVELAADLQAPVVSTHIGVVPDVKNDQYRTLQLAMREIASYAGMHGITIAIETGPEPPMRLRDFIEDVGEESLGVNFDPANLVMVQGTEPIESLKALRSYVVYTHAKDGRMVKKGDPAAIYDALAEGAPEDFRSEDYFLELPLGEGDVGFPSYLRALHAMHFDGYLTIEREGGADRAGDIARGVGFLRDLLGKLQ